VVVRWEGENGYENEKLKEGGWGWWCGDMWEWRYVREKGEVFDKYCCWVVFEGIIMYLIGNNIADSN
jgi:hypothetical protein